MLSRTAGSVLLGASAAIDQTARALLRPAVEAAAVSASNANVTSQVDHVDGPDTPVPAETWTNWHRDGAVRLRMAETGPAAEKPLSVLTLFRNAVEKVPNRVALASKVDGSWVHQTYEQYYENTRQVARGFIQLGLDRNSSVGVIGFNSAEWFQSYLGAIFAGGIAAGIYSTNSPSVCQFIAEHARCNIIVVDDEKQLEKILSIRRQLPHLRAIIQYRGQPDKRLPGVYSWAEFMKLGSQNLESELLLRIKDQAPNKGCSLVYTSGTVGNPKGAIISHDNVTWTAKRTSERLGLTWDNDVSLVSYLPLSHVAAQMADLYIPLCVGGTVYFAQPDALRESLVDTLKEVQPSAFLGVPRVYEKMHQTVETIGAQSGFVKRTMLSWARVAGTRAMLARMSGQRPSAVSRLADRLVLCKIRQALGLNKAQFCLSASAPISRSTLDFFASINTPLVEVYGLSETTGPHTFGVTSDNVIGSVGRVLDGTEITVNESTEDGVGEMLLNGRNIFMGYLTDEEKTRNEFGGPGGMHFKSGDLGRRDSRGFVYVTGRIKEIVITAGGENIPSGEIEKSVKERLPSILSNVMVIGDGRRYLTMLITLSTEIDPDTLSSRNQLTPDAIKWCAAHGSSATTSNDVILDKHLNEVIQRAIDDANRLAKSRAQRIQKWALLPKDFTIAGGEIGPTLKLRRHHVLRKYADIIESMYSEQPITEQDAAMTSLSSVNLHHN